MITKGLQWRASLYCRLSTVLSANKQDVALSMLHNFLALDYRVYAVVAEMVFPVALVVGAPFYSFITRLHVNEFMQMFEGPLMCQRRPYLLFAGVPVYTYCCYINKECKMSSALWHLLGGSVSLSALS
eukprot:6182651-Pleurochrysis_carterae.AAC.7